MSNITAEHRHAFELAQKRNARQRAEAAQGAAEAAAQQAHHVALATHHAAVRGVTPAIPAAPQAIALGGGTLTMAAPPVHPMAAIVQRCPAR